MYDVTATQNNDGQISHHSRDHPVLTINDPSSPCPTGTLTATPNCANPLLTGDQPRAYEVLIHGAGFQPSSHVTLVFDPERLVWIRQLPETVVVQSGDGRQLRYELHRYAAIQASPVDNYNIVALDQSGVKLVNWSSRCRVRRHHRTQ